jgi:hypothetical protein
MRDGGCPGYIDSRRKDTQMNAETKNGKLPVVVDDGFNSDTGENKLIRGVIVRCVEGNWTDAGGNPITPDTKLVAWATTECLQRWKDKLPVETIVKQPGVPLPDVEALNAEIPESEWEMGLSGKRPPWAKQHVVYLLNPQDGSEYTFISSTTGAAIAVERLRDKTKNIRMLRGDRYVPVVTLTSKLMQTRFGSKLRPDFTTQEWRALRAPNRVSAQPVAAIEHVGSKVEEPSLDEEMNDELPF